MSNSGGFVVTGVHRSNRFYNPPAVRRHQQLLLQQQYLPTRFQRPLKLESRVGSREAETRTDSDDSTISRSKSNSVCSSSPTGNSDLTNLDRLIESISPFVPAQLFPEARTRVSRNGEAARSFFCLGDLWESFKEWSVYGVGVPLLFNGSDSVKQYYVPYLSGIQLYVDPHKLRKLGEDSDAESSRKISSAGTSDGEAERRVKGGVTSVRESPVNLNFDRTYRRSLTDKPQRSSSSDDSEAWNSSGLLIFEYLEQEQPYHRLPLYDKVINLSSQFPDLCKYSSCDLLPASWVSVAWYPIYRIPLGPTLQNLDASFLTFHSLSTQFRRKNQPHYHASNGRRIYGVDASSKISLPVFGLASYKLRDSILTPSGAYERQQANSLFQAADNWLHDLHVNLPDFRFFLSHNSQWR